MDVSANFSVACFCFSSILISFSCFYKFLPYFIKILGYLIVILFELFYLHLKKSFRQNFILFISLIGFLEFWKFSKILYKIVNLHKTLAINKNLHQFTSSRWLAFCIKTNLVHFLTIKPNKFSKVINFVNC